MSGRQHTNAQRIQNHAAGQRKIRYRCKCGRIITGNAAWWSHLNAGQPECGYNGRA